MERRLAQHCDERAAFLEATSPARVMRLSEADSASADSVRMLHGQTTMPSVANEPLASGAPMSR